MANYFLVRLLLKYTNTKNRVELDKIANARKIKGVTHVNFIYFKEFLAFHYVFTFAG